MNLLKNNFLILMVYISTYCIHTYANPTKLIIENITSKKGTLYIQIPATINASAYAIVVFQDLNKNEKLDKSWFGIPKEPYGFSNNPSTKKGVPSFDEVILSQPKEGDIKIVLNGGIR